MAKSRKSRTEQFFLPKSEAKLPSPEEVNQTISQITGQPLKEPEKEIARPVKKRVPLTTAVTPLNRARLEVAAINSDSSVADLLNDALDNYFATVAPIKDQQLVETFIGIFGRKAKG